MQTVTPNMNNIVSVIHTTTTNNNSPAYLKSSIWFWVQATVTGTGAVTATIAIQGSANGTDWVDTALTTITLTNTTTDTDGASVISAVKYIRAVVTNVTGTGATVVVTYNG